MRELLSKVIGCPVGNIVRWEWIPDYDAYRILLKNNHWIRVTGLDIFNYEKGAPVGAKKSSPASTS